MGGGGEVVCGGDRGGVDRSSLPSHQRQAGASFQTGELCDWSGGEDKANDQKCKGGGEGREERGEAGAIPADECAHVWEGEERMGEVGGGGGQ